MKPIRTFVAVEVWPEIRERARWLIRQFEGTSAQVRWTDTAQLHLTMNFLGDVSARDIPAVCQNVSQVTSQFAPFDVEIANVGVFPSYTNPRTIWIGVGDGSDQLVKLYEALADNLIELGFRPEGRRFRPHLTIGRVRAMPDGPDDLVERLQQHAEFEAGPMMISEVTVFSSEMQRTGPVYEVLGHADLAAPKESS
ncbi:MAG: RNA 2',3'-cyclic phosphodiesterase [Planctomycetota bacterium]|nr:RNA 2',3'-cyclic phosphodiesterase [Planctomycetota bacterium]